MKKFITYYLYPLLLFLTLGLFVVTLKYDWDLKIVFAWMAGGRFALLLAVEFLFPLKQEWKMTKKSFIRDLKWIASSIIIAGLAKLAIPFYRSSGHLSCL